MSRNALLLEKASAPAAWQPPPRPGAYADLVRLVFRNRSALAVVAAGPSPGTAAVCHGIAAELAGSGKRVVIAQLDGVLPPGPLPGAAACLPGPAPNVWLWPPAHEPDIDFFQSSPDPSAESDWLTELRREFDAVLLACPAPAAAPAALDAAARADAAVLVVHAGRTTTGQVRRAQRALELAQARLVGCILIERR